MSAVTLISHVHKKYAPRETYRYPAVNDTHAQSKTNGTEVKKETATKKKL